MEEKLNSLLSKYLHITLEELKYIYYLTCKNGKKLKLSTNFCLILKLKRDCSATKTAVYLKRYNTAIFVLTDREIRIDMGGLTWLE